MEKKVCFNPKCKESSEKWRTGWRRRSGEYANLCDRCSSAYDDGKFCETFHLNESGWRCCESCGKNIHCGCIVSFHMFVLLDAGGIDCLTCAKKSYILTPNPAWPPPSHFLPSKTKGMKDLSARTSSEIPGSGPVPWLQAPHMFNGSNFQIDVRPMMPLVNEVSGGIDRENLSTPPVMEQESSYQSVVNGKPGLSPFEKLQNGNTGPSAKEQFYSSPSIFPPVIAKKDESSSFMSLVTASSSKTETKDTQISAVLPQPASVPILLGKHVASHNVMDSSSGTQIRNGKARGDGRGRNQLLPRYHPQITNEELQQIISDPKSVITPLFEKMLTASDAGRIGRLVLPKKCAEAYFPSIAQPEGLPLKVQDVKGNEWVFQFRFWPNNNSRMYVLEGITPCIQSMQLQAGDVVTFSRLDPEGKLVMGGRKAPTVEGSEGTINGSDSTLRDDISRDKSGEVSVNCHLKGKSSNNSLPINQAAKAGTGIAWSKVDSTGFIGKRVLEPKPAMHGKRKNSNLFAKSKRLKIESEDMIVLDLTWNQAQGLMRHPAKSLPSVFIVEGCKFEEFEESAPVIGRPTIPGIDQLSEKTQWVQCEDCFKWRKVPADALLPSRWICMENVWDPDRSFCSAAEEIATEQLEDMLLSISKVSSEKEITGQDPYPFVALEGLDTHANLATKGEGQSLSTSTKHPRHRHGCTCVVCLQPPSEKISNHEQSCNCVVCCSLNHSFRTLMRRHENKPEKEPESAFQKLQCQQLPEQVRIEPYSSTVGKDSVLNQEGLTNWNDLSASLLKGHIDLNIRPERDEETSLHSKSRPTLPSVIGNLVGEQMQQNVVGSSGFSGCTVPNDGNQKPDHTRSSCTSV